MRWLDINVLLSREAEALENELECLDVWQGQRPLALGGEFASGTLDH